MGGNPFMTILRRLRRQALKFGVDVHRYNAAQSQQARLVKLIAYHGIDTVIDVGANDGGYGLYLREGGYTGDIVSFEPLSDAHRLLMETSAKDSRWHVATPMALGAEDRTIEINVSGNSTSSSILPMNKAHLDAAPFSTYVGVERVMLRRIDGLAHPVIQAGRRLFLKVDAQGYEMPILEGAQALMSRIQGIQVELTLTPLYEGQALYLEVIDWMSARGYDLWSVIPGFTDPSIGRMLQMEGVFFRRQA
jgi:FkbM family methyltransferase